jgi:hypothetical protein
MGHWTWDMGHGTRNMGLGTDTRERHDGTRDTLQTMDSQGTRDSQKGQAKKELHGTWGMGQGTDTRDRHGTEDSDTGHGVQDSRARDTGHETVIKE